MTQYVHDQMNYIEQVNSSDENGEKEKDF